MTPETREVLASLLELTDGEIEALMRVHKTMRDALVGTDAKRVAEYHNDLLIALADERDRRLAALAALSDQLGET